MKAFLNVIVGYVVGFSVALAVVGAVADAHGLPQQEGCPIEEALTIEALIFQNVIKKRDLEQLLEKGDYTLEQQTYIINEIQGIMLRIDELVVWGEHCLARYEAAQ